MSKWHGEGDSPVSFDGNLEFRNVHFRYPSRKEKQILEDLNLRVESGQSVAFVGHSGCGNGNDVRTLNIEAYRKQFGIVQQEPVLFDMSVEENIRLGKLDATDDEVVQAATLANAHDFIMQLKDNYKAVCNDKLSGGQKQRICIARAIVSNPKILLLDEATSSLDNISEKLVQNALNKAQKGRTTLLIAHRLSTIRNADKIVVFDKGKIVESGSHDELIEKRSFYYNLVQLQSDNALDVEQKAYYVARNLRWSTEHVGRGLSLMAYKSFQSATEEGVEYTTKRYINTKSEVGKSDHFQLQLDLKIVVRSTKTVGSFFQLGDNIFNSLKDNSLQFILSNVTIVTV
ncbi:unnamed protein product, partial [Didymodactylos carnosus]